MALMVCNGCGCKFAVGLSMCPQCTSTDCREDGEMAPKITTHGGPSDAGQEAAEWVGTKPSTSSEKEPTTEPGRSLPDQSPAPTTENPSTSDLTGDSSAPSTDGESESTPQSADQVDPYEEWNKDDLQAELATRELPVSGNKPELVARLRENDAAPAADQE